MSTTNDGGPAFPRMDLYGPDGMALREGSYGMSLRDWLAAHAPEMPEQFRLECEEKHTIMSLDARWRYMHADAMLIEREKEGQP